MVNKPSKDLGFDELLGMDDALSTRLASATRYPTYFNDHEVRSVTAVDYTAFAGERCCGVMLSASHVPRNRGMFQFRSSLPHGPHPIHHVPWLAPA